MFFCQHHFRFSSESYARSLSGRFRPPSGPPSGPRQPYRVHYVGEKERFLALPSRKKSGHRKSIPVGYKHKSVPEAGNPPRRTDRFISECRTRSFVFSGGSFSSLLSVGPSATERLARTVLPSAPNCFQSIWPSASSSPWSFRATDLRVPSSAHRRNRSWARPHEPYRSGRSLQGPRSHLP
jgi:hypothetical protein